MSPATVARTRILLHAPDAKVKAWIERELAGRYHVLAARSAREIVTVLIDDPPPRPQVLVVDFDALSSADVLGLSSVRDRGWFGAIIALGSVSNDLARSMNINVVLARPLESELLREAVESVGVEGATIRIPTVKK